MDTKGSEFLGASWGKVTIVPFVVADRSEATSPETCHKQLNCSTTHRRGNCRMAMGKVKASDGLLLL